MEQATAIRIVLNTLEQLGALHREYKCGTGTQRLGTYARIVLEDKDVKTAIETLRRN